MFQDLMGQKYLIPITFKVGTLRFQNNRIEYTSSIDVDTTNSRANFCIEDLCYDFSSSKEVMYVEFSGCKYNTDKRLNTTNLYF